MDSLSGHRFWRSECHDHRSSTRASPPLLPFLRVLGFSTGLHWSTRDEQGEVSHGESTHAVLAISKILLVKVVSKHDARICQDCQSQKDGRLFLLGILSEHPTCH